MTASFALALQAAREAAAGQHYPQGCLYVVATPIGNLADISLRALHVLAMVDAIACEDTRHTQTLLRAYGMERPGTQLLAAHQHNEAEAATALLVRLRQGQRIAYVSDAGTPALSDPGARLVAAARGEDFAVMPLPGASSVTAALSAAGIVEDSGFVFAGFLSAKASERTAAVEALAGEARAVVILEAPHRVEALARALAVLGERRVTVGRELTKQFEEITDCAASVLADWLAGGPQRTRGEFVLVLHPAAAQDAPTEDTRVLRLLLKELPLKTAVLLAAEITGQARNGVYARALALRGTAADERVGDVPGLA